MTQAVVDGLVLQGHVEYVRARADVALQRLCDGGAGAAACLAVRLVQLREGFLEAYVLAVDLHADAGAQLFEEAHPGAVADGAEVGEDALLRLGELVRAELARLLDVVSVLGRVRVREERFGLLVGDRGQLQRKEHHVAAALRSRLARAGQEPAGGGVLRVLAVKQVGVDLGPDRLLLVGLELGHHRGELGRRQRRDLAPVLRLESPGRFERPGHQRLDGRVGW